MDTIDELNVRRVKVLVGPKGTRNGGVSQRTQSVLNRFVYMLDRLLLSPNWAPQLEDWLIPRSTSSGGQLEIMIQEGENVLRILDQWRGPVQLESTVKSEARSGPYPLFGVGDRGLYSGAEQIIKLLRDVVPDGEIPFAGGNHDIEGQQSAFPFLFRGYGVSQNLSEPHVDSVDLVLDPMTGGDSFNFTSYRVPTGEPTSYP